MVQTFKQKTVIDAPLAQIVNNKANIDVSKFDRKTALHILLKVARFFRETEPHSPLPYLLERAVNWGEKSFSELLSEIVVDKASLAQVCDLIGIYKE